MDWFTLLLILIFLVFPLIRQVLESRRGTPPPLDTGEGHGEEDWVAIEVPPERSSKESQPLEGQRGWSEGWGSWEAGPEEVSARVEVEVPRRERPARENSAAVERQRKKDDRDARRPPVPGVDRSPARMPTHASPRSGIRVVPVPASPAVMKRQARVPGPLVSGLTDRLRTPAELRRAIVLNEILGKPVGSRQIDGERTP